MMAGASPSLRRLVGVGLVGVLLGLGGPAVLASCSQKEPAPPTAIADATAPVDPALLAFLSRSKAAHHIADQYEQDGELQKAIEPLQRLVDGPAPGPKGAAAAPEVREVLADTLARLADLESQLGRYEPAAANVVKGLELARETTYFRGHLFEVRGHVEERRAKQLRDQGDSPGADAAKKRALEAFEQAMSIQEEVIRAAVPEEDAK